MSAPVAGSCSAARQIQRPSGRGSNVAATWYMRFICITCVAVISPTNPTLNRHGFVADPTLAEMKKFVFAPSPLE